MIRKLIIMIAIAISAAVISDYYGIITLPSLEKPAVLDNRDQMLHKTQNSINNE